MGRYLLRALIANGLVQIPGRPADSALAPPTFLSERADDGLLFGAEDVDPLHVDSEFAAASFASAPATTMKIDADLTESSDQRAFASLDDVTAVVADLTKNAVEPRSNDSGCRSNIVPESGLSDAHCVYQLRIDDGDVVARPGEPLNYTIELRSRGDQKGTGIIVAVDFPAELLQDVIASHCGVVDVVAGRITWSLRKLPASGFIALTVNARVRTLIRPTVSSITLTATVTEDSSASFEPSRCDHLAAELAYV